MSKIVYLNVGGTHIETTYETLIKLPYFQSLFKNWINDTSIDNKYFMDNDPKIFRHILNLLRNPSYNFPEKYLSELEYFGITYEELKEEEEIEERINDDINNSITKDILLYDNNTWLKLTYDYEKNKCPVDIFDDNERNKLRDYLTTDPKYTTTVSEIKRFTKKSPIMYETFTYDHVKEWSHQITPKTASCVKILLLLPKYCVNCLDNINITVEYVRDYKFSFNLEIFKIINRIKIVDNYLMIDLLDIILNRNIYLYGFDPHQIVRKFYVNFKTNAEIPCILKIGNSYLLDREEIRRMFQTNNVAEYSQVNMYEFKQIMHLPSGMFYGIVLLLDKKYYDTFCIIVHNNSVFCRNYYYRNIHPNDKKWYITEFDSRYIYKDLFPDSLSETENYKCAYINFNGCRDQVTNYLESTGKYSIEVRKNVEREDNDNGNLPIIKMYTFCKNVA